MALLPAIGTLSYQTEAGTVTFGPETETLGLSITPIESSDGRTSVGNRYVLRVRTVIAGVGGTYTLDQTKTFPDAVMASYRQILTTFGGKLTINGKGVGTIVVNDADLLAGDLLWGPRPRECTIRPIAGSWAVELIWQVEFVLTDCSSNSPYGRLMEFSWEADYTIDRDRLTKRDIKGMIRIPLRLFSDAGGRNADSIDSNSDGKQYYERVVPPVPVGWRRENEHRNFDRSKSVLMFSFTDQMLRAPLPPGVLDCDVNISHSSSMPLSIWQLNINATYRMAQDAPMRWSAGYFAALVRDRYNAILFTGVYGGASQDRPTEPGLAIPDVAVDKPAYLIPISVSISESPQSRTMSYHASFSGGFELGAVIMLGGLWRPLPYHTHNLWAQSMAVANRPRGYDQSSLRESYDVIVNLCDNTGTPRTPPIGPAQMQNAFFPGGFLLAAECPAPANSWLAYYLFVTIKKDGKVVRHVPLPKKPVKPKPSGSVGDLLPSIGPGGEQIPGSPAAGSGGYTPSALDMLSWAGENVAKSVIQAAGKPTYEIILTGYAMRACWSIDQPRLISVGGRDAIEANRTDREFFTTGVIGNAGVPIIGAKWRLRWILGEPPQTNLKPPSTPSISGGDDGFDPFDP